jgi:hypothetical protein
MGLPLVVEKEEDTATHCVYAFGSPTDTIGRVRLLKGSGDVEVLDELEETDGPSAQFYLAHLVPRLHTYHDRDSYPAQDEWTV